MSRSYLNFTVTGVDSKVAWSTTKLTSTEAETVKLLGLLLHMSGYGGNKIIVDLERKRLATLYDYHFDTDLLAGADTPPYSAAKMHFVELEKPIPLGQSVIVGLDSGVNEMNLFGAYVYDVAD